MGDEFGILQLFGRNILGMFHFGTCELVTRSGRQPCVAAIKPQLLRLVKTEKHVL